MSENEDFDPTFQKGRTGVEHRNIDAAGNEHPFGEEPQSFEADLRHLIRKVADDLYQSWRATVREYLANAETATLKVQRYLEDPDALPYDDIIVDDNYEPKVEITWNRREETLIIKDNGIGMAAVEVDDIFRQIGHSAARDDGTMSGQFGMGALSFVKLVGLDNAMIMTSHSRINDDNASYYVTLAGVEPIQGHLGEDEYGTKFQMTPDGDYNIRSAVEQYAEWMRVPVIYREIDEDGQEVFNEDWGDKALYESYDDNRICLGIKKENAFEAYCSPEANGETLLLSMEIDRNDGRHSVGQHGAPFGFDVRLLDESGKVIESSNGNEGLMPCPRSDHEQMLLEARDPYITRELLNNGDIVGQTVEAGPNEGHVAVDDRVLESDKPLPPGDYVGTSELSNDDEPGQAKVLIGPNQGRLVVPEEEWDEMDEGRAGLYVPDDELEAYDLESGRGDLTLPEPTSDRDRLQSHEVFWRYIGQQFAEQFDEKVDDVYELIDGADDALECIMDMEPENLSLALRGIRKLPSGRRSNYDSTQEAIEGEYGTGMVEEDVEVLKQLQFSKDAKEVVETYKNADLDNVDFNGLATALDSDEPTRGDVLNTLDESISSGLAPRSATDPSKKRQRESAYVPEVANNAYPSGTVYMAKSTGGAFNKKAEMAHDLHDDNQVVVVDDYDKWRRLLGWEELKQLPHGKNQIREELGDRLSDDLLERIAPETPEDDDDDDDDSDDSIVNQSRTDPKDEVLNVARGSRHRKRSKHRAEEIKESMEDPDKELTYRGALEHLILFPSNTDRNMTDHWWIPGRAPNGAAAIARCNKGTYEYLEDVDGVMHVDDYIDQAGDYTFESNKGKTTMPDAGEDLVIHIVSEQTRNRLMQETVFGELPSCIPEYYNENSYNTVEFPDPEDMVYAPVLLEDVFWLRPILLNVRSGEDDPIVLTGNVATRDLGKTYSMSSDYKLYSRARLPDWEFEWTELEVLDKCSYRVDLNEGGYEFIETLGLLHDMGEKPFSETPKARWTTTDQ